MAATKAQRIGIWIIAAFMAIGTIGSFAIIVLANSNDQRDQARAKELNEQYNADVKAQTKELSDKYFATFSPYASRAAAFDAASVTELKTEDIVVGDGDAVTSESTFSAYYVGWGPDGKIFDSSIEGEGLKAPIAVQPGGVIEGWTKGVDGMKVGGVRELTIPASMAYGETGSSDGSIAPNTPLKFVLMIVPTVEQVEVPQELIDLYNAGKLQ